MRTNYFLIDYENVQPEAIDALDQEYFKVMMFVGSKQTKMPFEVVAVLQRMAERAKYIKITGNGANALDFHIAFYIGELVAQDPKAYFHIISKDTGFDPLIQHLKSRKILVSRSSSINEISVVQDTNLRTPDEKLTAIIRDLQRRRKAKPGTVKALSNTINAIFLKKLSEQELTSLINKLQKQGIITIKETKVSYNLPE
jgi:hypothetical protein